MNKSDELSISNFEYLQVNERYNCVDTNTGWHAINIGRLPCLAECSNENYIKSCATTYITYRLIYGHKNKENALIAVLNTTWNFRSLNIKIKINWQIL